MLPDFPRIKEKLQRLIELGAKLDPTLQDPLFAQLGKLPLFEGDRLIYIQEDGKEKEVKFHGIHESFHFDIEKAASLTLKEYYEQVRAVYVKMEEQKAKQFLSILEEAADEAGNVVDGKEKPLDAENILAAMEKVWFNFDEFGKFNNLSLVIGPKLGPNAQRAIVQMNEVEPYKTRFAELVERKRMEWRDRESSRKLVG
jgi:hypothetical protein